MATNLNVTELDFDQIKQNLKNFLKSQSQFNDYDFEGSGLSVLLDILSYNTHYNAMLAHFAINESFLDSAQIRGNVVSRAGLLGYIPRSVLAPRAIVTLTVDVSDVAGTNIPSTLVIERGTKFNANVDGISYTFSSLNSRTAILTTVGNIKTYTFENIEIGQGVFRFLSYRVDNDIENQKFQISDRDADTSSLRVRIQENEASTQFEGYQQFTTLQEIDAASQVYYIQENSSGFYQIYFGDGVIGKKPIDNNIVSLDYLVTSGPDANGANIFTLTTDFPTIPVSSGIKTSVSTIQVASGGTDPETTESIRFNAPITFQAQDRAVTAQDYGAILRRNFANIESVSTWGGEDQLVPEFGKAFVSIKPLIGTVLTSSEKNEIINILKNKNIVSITPEIVDPEFTNLELDVIFKYNPSLTSRSQSAIESLVKDTVLNYNFNQLNKFDGVFRHSELLGLIDNADPAITSSTIRPFMHKNITPDFRVVNSFTLTYTGSFFLDTGTDYNISSTAFKIGGEDHFFGDVAIEGSTNRTVIIYKAVSGVNELVIPNAGLINPTTGIITLNNFSPDDNTSIRISISPNSLDVAPKRNQIINIESSRILVSGAIDNIAYSGPSGTIDYSTTSRMR
tara:strand:+ start:4932 stop:6800 length:1869 start_codon:yes stop_codon:yes gene_type:complete